MFTIYISLDEGALREVPELIFSQTYVYMHKTIKNVLSLKIKTIYFCDMTARNALRCVCISSESGYDINDKHTRTTLVNFHLRERE